MNPERDFWRIYPGNWIRLKHGYNVFIKEVIGDNNGNPIKVIAELDIDSKNMKPAKHKAKVALHWLSEIDCISMKSSFYNNLCDDNGEYLKDSTIEKTILVEKNLYNKTSHFEFERNGYFYVNNNHIHCLSFLKNR